MTDEGVLYFQTSFEHRAREWTARVEGYPYRAPGQDFWVESVQQHHVDRTVQTEVELFSAGQMRPAVRGEIGSTSREVEVFDPQGLIRDLEANGIDIFYLHMLDLGAE